DLWLPTALCTSSRGDAQKETKGTSFWGFQTVSSKSGLECRRQRTFPNPLHAGADVCRIGLPT
ncbi:hypothetical protein BaRGS_00009413, partial [Batillaria attramentaria]